MKAKQILILKGSPREKGNSAALAEQVAAGARAAGAEVESIYLHGLDIRPCDACELCHEQGADGCVIEDDMQPLYPKLVSADAIVIASPVYWYTISAQIKLCIDRWYALESPQGSALMGKHFALLLSFGESDPYTSGAINAIHTFHDIFNCLSAQVDGILYGSASEPGEIQEQTKLMEQAYKLGQKLGSSA
jgi:multimeric flavodoxin WrbA